MNSQIINSGIVKALKAKVDGARVDMRTPMTTMGNYLNTLGDIGVFVNKRSQFYEKNSISETCC